ncbi:MAG: Autotransporter-associated beta strand repeat-containing protein, partial [Lacunisphaera sp.]|nr:Autotransporter-associated beta strand repeat-containing protein [Lacunisphaera sp.]
VQVLAYIKTLSDTLRRIELLGLTRAELASSKAQIYGSILRARLNVEPEFFRNLVEGVPADVRVSAVPTPPDDTTIVAVGSAP